MQCKNCGKEFELSAGQTKCPYCGTEPNTNPGLTPPPEYKSNKPLWDNEGPFFTRLFNTWVEVMFHPTRFFTHMPVTGGIGKPLVYGLILGSFGVIVGTFWQLLWTMMQVSFIPSFGNHDRFAQMGISAFTTAYYIGLMVSSPIIILIGQFIWSGILHLCLMIFGGNKKGFEATFRIVAYSHSPGVFAIIPFCGGIVGGIWSIVLVIIGLKEAHQIPTWKAVLAYFLPLIFCCICGLILILIFGLGTFAFLSAKAGTPV